MIISIHQLNVAKNSEFREELSRVAILLLETRRSFFYQTRSRHRGNLREAFLQMVSRVYHPPVANLLARCSAHRNARFHGLQELRRN